MLHSIEVGIKVMSNSLDIEAIWCFHIDIFTRHALICQVYTGSRVYALVALNLIKYHSEYSKTHHFQIKNSAEGNSTSDCGRDPASILDHLRH